MKRRHRSEQSFYGEWIQMLRDWTLGVKDNKGSKRVLIWGLSNRDVPTDILGIQVETGLSPTCVTQASAGHTPWLTRPGLQVKFSCGPRKVAMSYSAYNLWKMH